jgi:hypothetical protein
MITLNREARLLQYRSGHQQLTCNGMLRLYARVRWANCAQRESVERAWKRPLPILLIEALEPSPLDHLAASCHEKAFDCGSVYRGCIYLAYAVVGGRSRRARAWVCLGSAGQARGGAIASRDWCGSTSRCWLRMSRTVEVLHNTYAN